MWNIDVCKTLMPPFPNIWIIGLTFDLDLWPTDLNSNMDHLLMQDYLPTKFEVSEAKRSWVISCTRFGRLTWLLTLTFDLLTWISIGIIYSSRTIDRDHLLIKDYLPTKFEDSGAKRSWVISCTRLRDTYIPTDMCNAICPSFFEGGHKNKISPFTATKNFLFIFKP